MPCQNLLPLLIERKDRNQKMNNWKYKLAAFMQGRYGIDPLNKAIPVIYLVFALLGIVFGTQLFITLGTVVALLGIYRFFSKQTARRAEENRRYMALRDTVKKKALLFVNRVKYYKTHRYRECPNCHGMLRLKKQIGTMTVNCPKCRTTFQVTIKH